VGDQEVGGRTAIVGIGATEFSQESGRTELRLALEAIVAALDDAGLSPDDVDGLVTVALDETDQIDIARNLRTKDLTFFPRVTHATGAAGAVLLASLAVVTRQAEVVVVYRALNERSGVRFGQPGWRQPPSLQPMLSWHVPFGLNTAAAKAALIARRYMHEHGATSEDFGRVSVLLRKYAATNPAARFYERPITLEEHQASRVIAEPLRLLDCCLESDGAVALVVASADRAHQLRQPPVVVSAAAQSATWDQEVMANCYRESITSFAETAALGRRLLAEAGIDRSDLGVANVYDHYTPLVLIQLEDLGFCGRGEAPDLVRSGALELAGTLPLNTNGGQIGEGYINGFNGVSEVVRQIRGTAANQVPGVAHGLVTSAAPAPTCGLVLSAAA
jgi:acetyl-CoA acetyltransferase